MRSTSYALYFTESFYNPVDGFRMLSAKTKKKIQIIYYYIFILTPKTPFNFQYQEQHNHINFIY